MMFPLLASHLLFLLSSAPATVLRCEDRARVWDIISEIGVDGAGSGLSCCMIIFGLPLMMEEIGGSCEVIFWDFVDFWGIGFDVR